MCWMAGRQQGVDFQFQWHFDSHSWACPNSFNPLCRQNNARSLSRQQHICRRCLFRGDHCYVNARPNSPNIPIIAIMRCLYVCVVAVQSGAPARPSVRPSVHPPGLKLILCAQHALLITSSSTYKPRFVQIALWLLIARSCIVPAFAAWLIQNKFATRALSLAFIHKTWPPLLFGARRRRFRRQQKHNGHVFAKSDTGMIALCHAAWNG